MIVDSSCDGSCAASEYHCPTEPDSCELCQIYCNGGKDSCKDGIFYSYSCKQVNIITNTSNSIESIYEKMTIYAPYDGNLNVTITNTGKSAFKGSEIYSNHTKNIVFNLNENTGADIAQDVIIYATDVQQSVKLNLFSDASKLQLFAPLSRKTTSSINCVGNIGNKKCDDIEIYSAFGIGNNVKLS